MSKKDRIAGIKAVFFDFGGTLYEVNNSVTEMWLKLLKDTGISICDETRFYESLWEARALLDKQTAERVHSKQNPEMSENYWVAYNALILEKMGVGGREKIDISKRISQQLSRIERKYKIINGVKGPLVTLKRKYKLGLISNTSYDLRKYLEDDGIIHLFDIIGLSYELQLWKPAKKIFFWCCNMIGVKPSECVYVGDSVICDVEGAANAGMIPILLDYSGKVFSEHITIKRIRELLNFLDQKEEFM